MLATYALDRRRRARGDRGDARRRLRRGLGVPAAAAVLCRRANGQCGRRALFFVGNLLVGAGFCVFCVDVLEQTTDTYGGLVRTLGWHFLLGREEQAPPPQAIAATVVAIDGLISCAVGSTILVGLLGRTYDHAVGIDALVAKNLVYFYGHSIANLTIYLAAAAIYVVVPRYAGRPYATTKVFVAGWMGSLVFIATAYSHHLYMDFVQPRMGRRHLRRSPRMARWCRSP